MKNWINTHRIDTFAVSIVAALTVGTIFVIAFCVTSNGKYLVFGLFAAILSFCLAKALLRFIIEFYQKEYIKQNKDELIAIINDFEKDTEQLDLEYEHLRHELEEDQEKYSPYYTYNDNCYNNKVQKVGCANNCIVFFETEEPKPYVVGDIEYGAIKVKQILQDNIKGVITESQVIPIDSIIYYAKEGDIQYTTHTVDSGTNVKGAIVGGVIAGQAGAIIGSRGKTSTVTDEHDSRCTIIKTEKDEFSYPLSVYDCLIKIIPDKELTYIQVNALKEDKNNKGTDEKESISLLREYKALLDDGIISQEEFEAKKKELL